MKYEGIKKAVEVTMKDIKREGDLGKNINGNCNKNTPPQKKNIYMEQRKKLTEL